MSGFNAWTEGDALSPTNLNAKQQTSVFEDATVDAELVHLLVPQPEAHWFLMHTVPTSGTLHSPVM